MRVRPAARCIFLRTVFKRAFASAPGVCLLLALLVSPTSIPAASALPATLPSTGQEFMVAPDIQPGSTTPHQFLPRSAHGSNIYFVVWQDARNGTSNYDIYGARVTEDGVSLDPSGIQISTASANQYAPAVAFGGGVFMVVWEHENPAVGWDIHYAIVQPDGAILSPGDNILSSAAGDQLDPSVTFNGTNFFVVWTDQRTGLSYDIYGARVTPGGTLLDPSGIPISTAPGDQKLPAISAGRDTCLVAWEDGRNGNGLDIYGAMVDSGGVVLHPIGFPVCFFQDEQSLPRLSFDGTAHWTAVWQDRRTGVDYNIFVSRVDMTGSVSPPSGTQVTFAFEDQIQPSIAFNGIEFAVVWQDKRNSPAVDVYGSRINTSGAVTDPLGTGLSGAPSGQGLPSTTRSPWVEHGPGTDFLFSWHSYMGAPYNAYRVFCKVGSWGQVPVLFGGMSATGSDNSVEIAWSALRDAFLFFRILRRNPSMDSYDEIGFVSEHGELENGGVPGRYTFKDSDIPVAGSYSYCIEAVSKEGISSIFGPVTADAWPARAELVLSRPAPNPVGNCPVEFSFTVPRRAVPGKIGTSNGEITGSGLYSLTILNAAGSIIRKLEPFQRANLSFGAAWDLKTSAGSRVPSGVYIVVLEAGGSRKSARFVVLR